MAEVGFSISGIPGAPLGPTLRITTTSPCLTRPLKIPSINSNSPSNTLAGPSKRSPSFPVILATEPPVARFPYNICKCPVALMALSTGRNTFCVSKFNSGTFSKFSASVFPVAVRQSPCSQPSFSKYFITAGTPPTLCRSSIMYLPLGFISASSGMRLLIA